MESITRVLIYALEGLFVVGLLGSLGVIAVTLAEDLAMLLHKENFRQVPE